MAVPIVGILGTQQAPAAVTNADVYTVPASRRFIGSTLVVNNTNSSVTTFRVFARKAGAAAAAGNSIAWDASIDANSHNPLTEGITLAATDVLTVQSAAGGVTFTLFGIEEDAV